MSLYKEISIITIKDLKNNMNVYITSHGNILLYAYLYELNSCYKYVTTVFIMTDHILLVIV